MTRLPTFALILALGIVAGAGIGHLAVGWHTAGYVVSCNGEAD